MSERSEFWRRLSEDVFSEPHTATGIPVYGTPAWEHLQLAAEAERRRQIGREFYRRLSEAWPELAGVATSIDEANAVWRRHIEGADADCFGGPLADALLADNLSLDLPFPAFPGTHQRAGITKNKRRGQSKMRRRMAAQSRRRNRR